MPLERERYIYIYMIGGCLAPPPPRGEGNGFPPPPLWNAVGCGLLWGCGPLRWGKGGGGGGQGWRGRPARRGDTRNQDEKGGPYHTGRGWGGVGTNPRPPIIGIGSISCGIDFPSSVSQVWAHTQGLPQALGTAPPGSTIWEQNSHRRSSPINKPLKKYDIYIFIFLKKCRF